MDASSVIPALIFFVVLFVLLLIPIIAINIFEKK